MVSRVGPRSRGLPPLVPGARARLRRVIRVARGTKTKGRGVTVPSGRPAHRAIRIREKPDGPLAQPCAPEDRPSGLAGPARRRGQVVAPRIGSLPAKASTFACQPSSSGPFIPVTTTLRPPHQAGALALSGWPKVLRVPALGPWLRAGSRDVLK